MMALTMRNDAFSVVIDSHEEPVVESCIIVGHRLHFSD